MKPEIAAQLRAHLEGRSLPTTGVDAPTVSDLQLDRQTRVAVRAQSEVIGAILQDLPRRRADIEEWAGAVLACRSSLEELADRVSGAEALLVQPSAPTPRWPWALAATVVGGLVALHVCEVAAIGWLLWR